jgi:hypothetical protein
MPDDMNNLRFFTCVRNDSFYYQDTASQGEDASMNSVLTAKSDIVRHSWRGLCSSLCPFRILKLNNKGLNLDHRPWVENLNIG